MKGSISIIGSAFLALALVACGSSANTSNAMGGLRTTVHLGGTDASALSAKPNVKSMLTDARGKFAISDVTTVTVSIVSSDPAAPAIAPLVLTGASGTYTGAFPQLRASANDGPTYALSAKATDFTGAVLYEGAVSNVTVTAGSTGTVFIIANSTAPVAVTDVVPVRITAIQANETARSGETLTFKVTRNGDATGTVVVAWTQLGSSSAAFGAPAQETTTWTAPTTTTALTETIKVSLSNGAGAASTFSFSVSVTANVDVPVNVSLNDRPVIAAMELSAPQIAPNASVILTVNATDTTADTLSYTFSKGTCLGGAFNVEGIPQVENAATFTADGTIGVCRLRVTVTDGRGGEAQGTVTLSVDPTAPDFLTTVFNEIPAVLAPNVPSQAFQAQQTAEFGDYIQLAGTARHAASATVMMSNWALASTYPGVGDATGFVHPITLNIYRVVLSPGAPPALGALIGTVTQDFRIPWRPEATATCGTAWLAADGECYNGHASTITFDLSGITTLLPDSIIYGIAYNTNSWGYAPIRAPGPYESLNVGLVGTPTALVGTDVDADAVFWNTQTAGNYADGGSSAVGTFRQDTHWTGYTPAVQFRMY